VQRQEAQEGRGAERQVQPCQSSDSSAHGGRTKPPSGARRKSRSFFMC
jgi:hypothetical protein